MKIYIEDSAGVAVGGGVSVNNVVGTSTGENGIGNYSPILALQRRKRLALALCPFCSAVFVKENDDEKCPYCEGRNENA